jgi:hypothetical protein
MCTLVLVFCFVLQELMLRSSRPLAALEMRQQLKHWPEALALAQRFAPDRVSALSKEHAAMLELVGEHAEAKQHYQQVRPSSIVVLYSKHAAGPQHRASRTCMLSQLLTELNTPAG